MRILKTIHQFLPRHVAGSEVNTYLLCKELLNRHEVRLFVPNHFGEFPPYETRRRVYDGIPITEFCYAPGEIHFEKTYRNPKIDALFLQTLDEFKPDLLHIQHLFFLTPRFVRLARERGIPVVMTLHEYGYQCPSGGLRMRPDFKLCETIDPGLCARCVLDSPSVFRGSYRPSRFEAAQARLGRELRRPFEIAGLDGFLPPDPALKLVRDRDQVMREALGEVDLFLAPSRYLLEKYREWGLPSEKLLHLDYGFDTNAFRALEKKPSLKTRFAFIGSVMPHKGVDILVEAFNRLPEGGVELKIYGEPSYHQPFYDALKKKARHSGISFEGFLPADKVAEAYAGIDALVVPSRWFENSPLTIHEAFLAGVPVITSDLGGMKELVTPGENGLLFETGNPGDLHRALTEYLARPERFEASRIRSCFPVTDFKDYAAQIEVHYERLAGACTAAK